MDIKSGARQFSVGIGMVLGNSWWEWVYARAGLGLCLWAHGKYEAKQYCVHVHESNTTSTDTTKGPTAIDN